MPLRALGNCVFIVALVSIATVVTGCDTGRGGRPTAHLSGAITIDGQTPEESALGTINFRAASADQAAGTSAEIVNGKYDAPNVPMGNVTAFIQLVQPTGRTISEGDRQYPELRSLISSKYDVGIKLEVTGDNHNQDLDLTSQESSSRE